MGKLNQQLKDLFLHRMATGQGQGPSCNPMNNVPYFFQEDGQTKCSIPVEMIRDIQDCPHLSQMKVDCAKQGVPLEKITGQQPTTQILTPKQYVDKVTKGEMPPMKNFHNIKEMAERFPDDETKIVMMSFAELKPE